MSFLSEKYLLTNETAVKLYETVRDLPIVDAHNHGDVKEIVENKGWNDIWEVEAATDHYVWELMRRRGVSEEKITGNATNYEKWLALAEVFPKFVGNPTYEWIHLDLRRRFGIDEIISKETANSIWWKTKQLLKDQKMKPQELLRQMNVEIMCTTDDPTSDLKYHKIAQNSVEGVKILPTWRPDRACRIDKADWKEYIQKLSETTATDTMTFNGFLDALKKTHDYFDQVGCVCSDHALLYPVGKSITYEKAKEIFNRALKQSVSLQDLFDFQSYMLYVFAQMNHEKNWKMQLHIGALRDYRDKLFEKLGPDSGGDISAGYVDVATGMRDFFNTFDGKTKIILYCLDTTYLSVMTTIARAFENVFLGAPWWFNDSPYGMQLQLQYIASVDLLSNLVGMVTDSRKLMSYGSRTEMFRRVLSSVVGEMVEKGQIPLKEAVELCVELSYTRPKEFFFA
ncbi:glucuronate isomerase [Thermotoga profunda]|uniref:glucuronate isomerase n=1 Tax=Thermotoga profunda TaxID=1508420 RepID=UPI0005972C5D|nr:glucuronate isomerase [Thermotoga profunda]